MTTESGESFTADYDSGTGRVSFTMPEEDCTVTFTPAEVKQLGWTQTAGIETVSFHEWDGFSLGEEITAAYSGVQVAAQVHYDQENYNLNSVYAYDGGEALSYSSSADAFILTVPEDHEVELTFDMTAWENVTITAENAIVTGLGNRYQVGEIATFQVVPDIGYVVTGISVEGAVVEEESTAGSYTFVVPYKDLAGVEVVVSTEYVGTTTIETDPASRNYGLTVTDTYGRTYLDDQLTDVVTTGETLTVTHSTIHGFIDYSVAVNGTALEYTSEYTAEFTANEGNIVITVNATQEESHGVTLSDTLSQYASLTSVVDDGYSLETPYVGHQVTAIVTITESGWIFAAGTEATVSGAEDVSTEISSDGLTATVTFTMPSQAVEIDIEVSEKVVTTVTITGEYTGTLIVSSDPNAVYGKTSGAYSNGDEVETGATVYIVFTTGTIEVVVTGNTTGTVYASGTASGYSSHVTFNMPTESVTITVTAL